MAHFLFPLVFALKTRFTFLQRPFGNVKANPTLKNPAVKAIAYYRVSTARQGQSGLGLEAQQAAVAAFCEPIETYTEVETGKRSDRPELQRAIAACKRMGATLVVAKLDRLARNVAFVSTLMESGVEFVACDNPTANRLTVHILAAVAEDEARRISERTKAALAAYKARGGTLGNPSNLTTVAAPISGLSIPIWVLTCLESAKT